MSGRKHLRNMTSFLWLLLQTTAKFDMHKYEAQIATRGAELKKKKECGCMKQVPSTETNFKTTVLRKNKTLLTGKCSPGMP